MAFPTDWDWKCKLTISATNVDAALSDWPLYVGPENLPSQIFDADGTGPALSGGGDVRFSSDSDGLTQLACEVVTFTTDNDPANGTAEIWVKVPSVSASVGTDLYIWWGKAGESQPAVTDTYGRNNVWDSSFLSVCHLSESVNTTTNGYTDSTGNANHGTGVSLTLTEVDAPTGKGQDLDNNGESSPNDYIKLPDDLLASQNNWTCQGWTYNDQTANSRSPFGGNLGVGSNPAIRMTGVVGDNANSGIYAHTGSSFYWTNEVTSGRTIFIENEWTFIAFRHDNTTTGYTTWGNTSNGWNTQSHTVSTGGQRAAGNNDPYWYGGGHNGSVNAFDGKVSEGRVSTTARALAWLKADYFSQNDPATFITTGTPEGTVSAPSAPTGVAAVGGNEQVTVSWNASAGATSYNIYWDTSSPITSGDSKISGVSSPYTHTGRSNGTPYYYAVTAENAGGESALSSEVSATPAAPSGGLYKPGLDEMAFANYQDLGLFGIDRWELGGELRLRLVEPKALQNTEVPSATWNLDEFPNLEAGAIGKAKALCYGTLLRVPAYCVDTETNTFRVAGHAISAFRGTYAQTADGEQSFDATGVDTANAEFVYADWDGTSQVSVDLVGRIYSVTGEPMTNPADVIEDLLTDQAGQSAGSLDATAFSAARASWKAGESIRYGTEDHWPNIALLVDTPTRVTELVERVAQAAYGWVTQGADGLWTIGAWAPVPGEGLTEFGPAHIFDLTPDADSTAITTRVLARYAIRHAGQEGQQVDQSNDAARYVRNLPEHRTHEIDLPLSEKRHAEWWAGRWLAFYAQPVRTYVGEFDQRALTLSPGDYIRVEYDIRNLSGVYEVYEVAPLNGRVRLVLGDVRGMGDGPGFWAADAPTFPTRLGGGSTATWSGAWSAAQKAWARENLGYWTDDNGFASATDDASRNGSEWS